MATSKGVALVTGAAQGIGRAITLRLAADGYDVAINDIQSKLEVLQELEKEIISKNAERKVVIVIADVSAEEEVQNMITKVVEGLGGLDVMIANAGILIMKPILEVTTAELERILAINVRGVFLCYKYAAKQMIEQGRGGRLVGACSYAGKQGSSYIGAYSATKFAVRGLTQSFAHELGKYGITVNAYAPGSIDTPMSRTASEAIGGWDFLVNLEKTQLPIGVVGAPEDVAGLVSYLVSKEARYITGQSINLNGGRLFD